MRISRRAAQIQPSSTLVISEKAQRLRREGVDVISFGAGEPDFDTPDHIKEAAVLALSRGATKYTPVSGLPELRQAAAEEFAHSHRVPFTMEQVLVSSGAKQSLYNLFMALCDDGDEVIIPIPSWVSHTEIVKMAGGVPVLLPLSSADSAAAGPSATAGPSAPEGFRLDLHALSRLISQRTRAILLCSPSNPTGAVYDRDTVAGVAALVQAQKNPDLIVVTDDLYKNLVYGGAQWHSVLHFAPELAAQTVLVDGVSKSHAMTGWRIGFCAAPRPLHDAMENLQGQTTTHATTVAQHAALAALTGDRGPLARMVAEFDRRRQVMYRLLLDVPGLRCAEPQGAFYCFPDVRAYLSSEKTARADGSQVGQGLGNRPATDEQLAEWLLDDGRIAAVPGTGFHGPGHLRFSYATSIENIEEGMRRLKASLARLGLGGPGCPGGPG